MIGNLTQWMDQKLYPDSGKNWDDEIFRERVLACIQPQHVVLDLGAGAGIVKQMNFKGFAVKICGVDLDPRVVDNPMLDEGRVSDAGAIPYDDAMFDVIGLPLQSSGPCCGHVFPILGKDALKEFVERQGRSHWDVKDAIRLVGPQETIIQRVEMPATDMGNALRIL